MVCEVCEVCGISLSHCDFWVISEQPVAARCAQRCAEGTRCAVPSNPREASFVSKFTCPWGAICRPEDGKRRLESTPQARVVYLAAIFAYTLGE